jgi:outer membrane autotransporter protein
VIASYRAETALYTALPAMAVLYGRAAIDNLHGRVGEAEQLRRETGDSDWVDGAWVRFMHWHGQHDGGRLGVYSDKGPDFDFDLDGLQLGLDVFRHEADSGARDHVGAYVAFGDARAEVQHIGNVQAGTDVIDAWSLGAYWTHFWPGGAYLDAVAQHSWYDAEGRSVRIPALKGEAAGWAGSLEGGLPLQIDARWTVEPEAQLTYQHFNSSSAEDIAARIVFKNTDSLVGRLGVRAAFTWSSQHDDGPRFTTAWVRLNASHEFMDGPATSFATDDGPVVFQADLGSYWLELDTGFTKQISQNAAVFASGGYTATLDDDIHAWTAKVGARFKW